MTSRSVSSYIRENTIREPEVAAKLRAATGKLPMGMMQISPETGQLLATLVTALGAKRCLEIGTFTGYSALWVALALPKDGRIIACDVSKEWTDIGRRFWAEAGIADKIDLRL